MSRLSQDLRDTIHRQGAIPFSEFMRQALYHPTLGYYRRPERIGRSGDFYTSVTVGKFFGALLAFQFARWLEQLAHHGKQLRILEAGAHDGQLACDILDWFRQWEPALLRSFDYWLVEPSSSLEHSQQARLSSHKNVRWAKSFAELEGGVAGIIFSNELLDAMPIHVFRWKRDAGQWCELGVAVAAGEFAWTELNVPAGALPQLPQALLDVLPDGYIVESCPEAIQWWRAAAASLEAGKLMTIDYGGVFEELLSPARPSGTLRAYSRQRVGSDVLKQPGEQDITAHVNFTEIEMAGRQAGLRTEVFTLQSRFLSAIARDLWNRTGSWPMEQVRQFQTLTHPEHLGHPFRVLVQAR